MDEPVETIPPGERGEISGITNASENPLKIYPGSEWIGPLSPEMLALRKEAVRQLIRAGEFRRPLYGLDLDT
jgi:hypothetical protein